MPPMQPPDPFAPPPPPRSTPLQPGSPVWGPAPLPPSGPLPPYGMPLPPATRPHGLATAALVCGLVGLATFWLFGIVPLLALIFGLSSVRTIRNSGGTLRGLGMARAGWILGLIGVVGAAAFLWAGFTGRLDDESEGSAESETSNSLSSSYQDAAVGDCVGSVPVGEVVYELDFVSCDVAHAAEVYAVGELNANQTREYPGDVELLTEVQTACAGAFEPYVGRSYELSVFEVYYLYPRRFGWRAERGSYVCFLVEEGKTNTGSVFQSDR